MIQDDNIDLVAKADIIFVDISHFKKLLQCEGSAKVIKESLLVLDEFD